MKYHSLNLLGSATMTSVTDVSIGTITLPSGPASDRWNLIGVVGSVVCTTQLASDSFLRIVSQSGDVQPQPAPLRIPLSGGYIQQSTPAIALPTPVAFTRLGHRASGKSQLEFYIHNESGTNFTGQYSMSLIISDGKADIGKEMVFSDFVRAAINAAATEVEIGTITVAENAKRLVAACAIVTPVAVAGTSTPLQGMFRLSSNDVQLTPMSFPISNPYSGSSTAPNIVGPSSPVWMPIDVDVPGGARIICSCTTQSAVSSIATIYLAYA